MSGPRATQAAEVVKLAIRKEVRTVSPYRAEGRSITAGYAIVRQNDETIDDAQQYSILVPCAPTPGVDAAMLPIDGGEVYIGAIVGGSPLPTLNPGIGQTIIDGGDQNTADNSSTSNNDPGNFVNAMQRVTAVPNGVYDVLADGSFLGGHSAGDSVQFRLQVNGTAGNTRAKGVPSSTTTLLRAVRLFPGIVVSGGSLTTVIEYRRGDALTGETASAAAPAIAITAMRRE